MYVLTVTLHGWISLMMKMKRRNRMLRISIVFMILFSFLQAGSCWKNKKQRPTSTLRESE